MQKELEAKLFNTNVSRLLGENNNFAPQSTKAA